MKVSIIIPVYNVSKYIEKSINCICNQTMQEGVECIIVNDCTPDDSIVKARRIIDAYNGSIVFNIIEHEKNRGLAAARSTGMKHATGDYVLHLDSDDFYEYNMVEELYNSAIKNNADVAICDFYKTFIDKEVTFAVKDIVNTDEYVSSLIRNIYSTAIWNVWNKMFKRELFYRNSIDWTEGIDYGEDVLICSKLFCFIKRIVMVNKPLYHYTNYNIFSYTKTLNISVEEKTMPIINEIELFLKRKNLYDKFESDVNFRKLSIKIILLRFGKKESRSYYNTIYPEANEYIWKSSDISFLSKIKLYCSRINLNIFIFVENLHNVILAFRKNFT